MALSTQCEKKRKGGAEDISASVAKVADAAWGEKGWDGALESREGVWDSRRSGKTTSWKRCKADSILCSGDIRLVLPRPLRTSLPFRTLHPHPPRFAPATAYDFLAQQSLHPTITTPTLLLYILHQLNHHRRHEDRLVAATYFSALGRLKALSFGMRYLPTSKMAAKSRWLFAGRMTTRTHHPYSGNAVFFH